MLEFGWRATAIGSGLLAIALGVPLSRFFRGRPADLGETIDGEPPLERSADGPPAAAPEGAQDIEFTAREAMRTRAFWLLALAHGAALLVVTSVNVHAITHMKEGMGYTVAQASLVISLMTVAQIGGVGIGMLVGDRYNKRLMAAGCMVMHALGLLMLTWANGVAMLVGFAVLHGTAWGLRGPFMQAIRADYFGRRSIGMIMGLSSLIISFGQIAGPLVAGGMADLTGNYRTGFTFLALLAGAGGMLFVWARPPGPPQRLRPSAPSPH